MSQILTADISNENGIILQKDIFRLAALLYTETTNTFSSIDVQLYIVKCVFAENNDYMSSEDIILYILNNYKYHLSEEELERIITKPGIFEFISTKGTKKYRLLKSEYEQIVGHMSRNMEYYISLFIEVHGVPDVELFRDAIYKFLYELTTTNINSYKVLLALMDGSNLNDADLSVNVDELSDAERKHINRFISWDNAEKNVALSNLVFCCLEYCLLVSGDKPNRLISNTIRRREIFLDTNIIFRALGINGLSRKNVVLAFLGKCQQANVKLTIGKPTKKEFWSTVDYYISQISEFPRGKVFVGAYESLSDYNLYSFYDEWYANHENLSLKYFRIYIASLYDNLVKAYRIHDDLTIPNEIYDSDGFKSTRDSYAREITAAKRQLKQLYISEDIWFNRSDKHDASMIRYVELYRAQCSPNADTFFVSSDKGLRYWEMTRTSQTYPIVIYPSQLFLVLIKMCGRSDNDLECFVNFINIRPRSQQLSAEKANIIISGISSITEDITAQQNIVSMVMEGEFQNIIKHSNSDHELYQHAQLFSQKYLESDLEDKKQVIQDLSNELQEKDLAYVELKKEMATKDDKLSEKQNEIELHRENICDFAEKKTRLGHGVKWYVVPISITLYSIAVVLFIAFQFIYSDASWNIVNNILSLIEKTTFGKGVGDYIYVIDLALGAFMIFLTNKFWANPFDKAKRREDRAKRVKGYIERNNLLKSL